MAAAEASVSVGERAHTEPRASRLATVLVAPAAALVILAISLVLLMTPIWMHFALATSGATGSFASPVMAYQISDSTVAELFTGPGTFSAFGSDEAAHMRDVRVVLFAFLGLAAASLVLLIWSLGRHSRDPQTWRAIARGGAALAIVVAVLGVFGALAFGVAFDLFHELLFPGGNWSFPPTSLLIRLYPIDFWQLTAGAFGALAIGGGFAAWFVGRRRARQLSGVTAE